MLSSGRIVRWSIDVTSVERRGVFGNLQLSLFLQSREEESQCDARFQVSPPPSPSQSLFFSELEF